MVKILSDYQWIVSSNLTKVFNDFEFILPSNFANSKSFNYLVFYGSYVRHICLKVLYIAWKNYNHFKYYNQILQYILSYNIVQQFHILQLMVIKYH